MQSTKSVEQQIEKLAQGRKAALAGLFTLLIGASALLGIGAAIQNSLMVYYSMFVVFSSPIFLTIAIACRIKIKKLARV